LEIFFNIKDIFHAPRSALSLTKILTFFRAHFVSYFAYLIANYAALFFSGNTLISIWKSHGMYPYAYAHELNWYSSIIFWASVAYWLLAIYGTMCAVSKITLQELRGDYFYSIRDAHNFIEKNWYPLIFTPITILMILAFYVLSTSFFGLLSKIPLAGSLIISIPFLIYLLGAVFAAYTFYVLLISIIFTPTIIATTKEDTMGSVFISYMLAWRYPLQIIGYKLILTPIVFASQIFLIAMIGSGFKIMDLIFSNSFLMSDRFTAIFSTAASFAIPKKLLNTIFGSFSDNFYSFCIPNTYQKINGFDIISSFIIGFFIIMIALLCISYALSVFSTGSVYILNILMNRSGINFIDIKNKEDLISKAAEK